MSAGAGGPAGLEQTVCLSWTTSALSALTGPFFFKRITFLPAGGFSLCRLATTVKESASVIPFCLFLLRTSSLINNKLVTFVFVASWDSSLEFICSVT